jgi:hypothetical protein
MILPRTIYFAAKDYERHGIGFTDPQDSADAALDIVLEYKGDPVAIRIFRVDFCPNTNLPELIQDVTEETVAARNAWLAERGIAKIEVAA